MAEASTSGATSLVRVWDLPTRLFHWVLALCVLGSVLSAKIGGNAMVWHMRLGYAVLTLLLFRLLWGLVGGRWSRFARFVYSPAAWLRYLRGRPQPGDWFEVGHSPLGALAVLAMLGWLVVQVGSGLIADDEIAITGPLVRFVSMDTSLAWTGHHKSWGQWLIYALVALHVLAIVFYRVVKKRRLVGPMISGDKALPPEVPASRDSAATRWLALLLLAASAAAVAWLVSLGTL
ncbi:cytochrome b/b6 domain-containing protein [Roseateles cavernae]|uniref:cytochrome b/b6 domain-containing protein n=1 Tax=Roseateles cavernae TaxID=3153578 RepID=UPI0032E39D2C